MPKACQGGEEGRVGGGGGGGGGEMLLGVGIHMLVFYARPGGTLPQGESVGENNVVLWVWAADKRQTDQLPVQDVQCDEL